MDMDELRARFRPCGTRGGTPHSAELKEAAVLVLVLPGEMGPEIVLTRRSDELPRHAGQICLPGGRRHREENLLLTALREAEEEIGLAPEGVEVLGPLPIYHLPSGWCVTPVVAICERPSVLRPCPREVEEIFTIPLERILDPGLYLRGSRTINNIKRDFYYFDFNGYYVWGATAAILQSLGTALHPPAYD